MNGANNFSPYGAPPPPAYGYAPQQPGPAAYQQPPAYQQAPVGQYGYAPPPPMAPMGMGMMPVNAKNPGLAVGLELGGGFLFQTFGIGHLYAGNIGMGLGLMFGYWALTAINIVLCFALIGFVTWPITWIAFMVLSAITANNAAKKANLQMMGRQF
jgi:hypothetical protein